jgi:hypothetical protein
MLDEFLPEPAKGALEGVNTFNLVILMITWSASAFCFYNIAFSLKYIPGSLYANFLMATFADMLAKPAGYAILSKVGLKRGLVYSYGFVILGTISLLLTNFLMF